MRLLIAGWQGQVARALLEQAPGRPDITACAAGRPALDICEIAGIERALAQVKPDVVINTAAYTDVDGAEDDEARAMAMNRDGPRLLAELAAKRGAAIIHLSTDYVFDGAARRPYVETDATNPATVYGRSKLAGEAAVRAANPRHVILRTSWVYSPFSGNFVSAVAARARDGAPLRVVADRVGSPTYAPHLARAILDIAARLAGGEGGAELFGTYHAAGDGAASWYDIALDVVRRRAPHAPAVERISSAEQVTRAPRPAYAVLDCGKLAGAFGLRLPPWQAGVEACLAGTAR